MTKQEAIEKCASAIVRERGDNPDSWKTDALANDLAKKMVICLQELGLLPLTA